MNLITVEELHGRLARGERLQLVDVRSPGEYEEAHMPTSINVPMEQALSRLDDMRPDEPVVLVCQSGNRACLTHDWIAPHRGSLLVLDGGLSAWQAAGRPVVGGRANGLPLMRQVQLVVGPLIVVSVALGWLIDVRWLALAAFVGLGLTMAGATGFCGMARLLAIMPWNRRPAMGLSEPEVQA